MSTCYGSAKAILSLALLSIGAGKASAQTMVGTAHTAGPIEYYDADDIKLPSAVTAHHSVQVIVQGSVSGIKKVFYPSGQPRESTRYANLQEDIRDGESTTWYESGQLHSQGRYQAGKLEGELLVYHPDGKLKRREMCGKGSYGSGACYGPDGKPTKYYPYECGPVYKGGIQGLLRDLSENLQYPQDALQGRVQGRVLVKFTVTRLGRVAAPQIVQGLTPSTEAEAMRVVQELRDFTPAQRDEEAIPVHFTVPITFALGR